MAALTLAVCLKCGAEKFGALVRCRSCGFEPTEEEDQAKSLLVSDHYLSGEDLANVPGRIKSGQGVKFDPASVQSLVEVGREIRQDRLLGVKAGPFTCGIVVILGIMLGLVLMGLSYFFGK